MKRHIAVFTLVVLYTIWTLNPALSVKAQTLTLEPFRNMQEDVFNEYDYIMEIRKTPREYAENKGYLSETLDLAYSDYAEQEFLRRGSLCDEELKERYRYSEEQIKQLRCYDGKPLQEAPEMRALSASMSSSLILFGGTGTMAILLYSWEWSTLPIFRFTDSVAMTWSGTYNGGGSNNMTLHSSSYTRVFYYYSGSTYFTTDYNVTSGSALPTVGAYSSFPFSNAGGDAYRGYMYVKTTLVNMSGPRLHAISAHAEYAHFRLTLNPSASFSSGLSISFSGAHTVYGSKSGTFYIPDPE